MKQYKVTWLEITNGQAKLRQFASNKQNAAIDLYCYLQTITEFSNFYDFSELI